MAMNYDLTQVLKGVSFPVSRLELIATLRKQNAPEELIRQLQAVTQERFASVNELTGKITATR